MENNVGQLKKRFSLLLNHLLRSGLTQEYIEEKIVRDPYFLFLENNEVESFLKTPFETIIKKVFSKEVYIDYSLPLISEYIWAGEMYITIALNENIPLQRLFLLLPISAMLSLFNPYHEMNNYHLVKKYLDEYDEKSIIKHLANEKSLTIREISSLTGIGLKTLLSYLDNDKLFKASINNLYLLANFFDVPICLFNKQSSYLPFSSFYLKDLQILSAFMVALSNYLNVDLHDMIIDQSALNPSEVVAQKGKYIFHVSSFSFIFVKRNKKTIKYLNDKEVLYLGKQALNDTKNHLTEGMLLF